MRNDQTPIPGLEPPTTPDAAEDLAPKSEAAFAALKRLGYLEDYHEARIALALVIARDIDRSKYRGAPSGRANLYRVYNEVLNEIPMPEAVDGDGYDDLVAAIMAAGKTDDARA